MYKETQQFRQPWIWVLLLACLGLALYRWQPVGIGTILAILALFWFLRLETIIDQAGISYRWFPFQNRYRVIKWEEIEQITVRNYSALGEFGAGDFVFPGTELPIRFPAIGA